MSLDTVLFDLDGTLIDSIELILSSFRHTMKVHHGLVPPEEQWLAGLGTPIRVQFKCFTDDPDEIEAMVATYRAHNQAHHDTMVREYPGALAAVRTLREQNTRLAVVTSKFRESAARGLRLCGMHDLFDILVSADDVANPKPDPEPVRRALDLLDSRPERSVFVGDSVHDMAAGRAAGVKVAAALWGPFPRSALEPYRPDVWLAHPSEIATLLDHGGQ